MHLCFCNDILEFFSMFPQIPEVQFLWFMGVLYHVGMKNDSYLGESTK